MVKRLLCIGEVMIEMAAMGDGLYRRGFAGDTFNTCWHARRALPGDWQVAYGTALGDDPTSDAMVDFIARAGIDTGDIQRLPGAAPGLYMIDLKDGERSFTYWRGASAARRMAENTVHLRAMIAKADVIYISGITLAILPQAGRDVVIDALGRARRAGKTIAFDGNLRRNLWSDPKEMLFTLGDMLEVTTMAMPTWPDEAALWRVQTPQELAQVYLDNGAAEVVVKSGEKDALVATAEGQIIVPVPKVIAPVDTTGAGDSFNAAYLAARLTGQGPEQAALAGHALAGQVIGHHGALGPDQPA